MIDPIAPPLLSLVALSDYENQAMADMSAELSKHAATNATKLAYYESERLAKEFGISIPPRMQGVATPTGWPGTVVDVVEERLDWLGWTNDGEDTLGLTDIYKANSLGVDSCLAHLDALIYGTGFVVVGTGFDGEPDPLITVQSPLSMTARWDPRSRRLQYAWAHTSADHGTLYLPNVTITAERLRGRWVATDRDEHNLGRVPVVQFENRARSDVHGRSEITKAIRYYTDAAIRTLLGLEVSREFYNSPKLAALNMYEDAFQDADGNPTAAWDAVQGRVFVAEPNGEGEPEPKLVTIPAASPAPYLDQITGYATLVAAEAGIPPAYLGIQNSNPSSADAIRALESRLVKRIERRQLTFDRGWMEVANLAVLLRDGAPGDLSGYNPRWRDAATPTRAAAADAAMKLVSAGILSPDSQIVYDLVGISPSDQLRIASEKRRTRSDALLESLTVAPETMEVPGGNPES